jgi:hypothetical protein
VLKRDATDLVFLVGDGDHDDIEVGQVFKVLDRNVRPVRAEWPAEFGLVEVRNNRVRKINQRITDDVTHGAAFDNEGVIKKAGRKRTSRAGVQPCTAVFCGP